jgi:hypothetical protein
MKVAYNNCFGGFSISKACAEYMAERGCEISKKSLEDFAKPLDPNDTFDAITLNYGGVRTWYGYGDYERNSPLLIEAIETLGSELASGSCARLAIAEIPDGAQYEIDEYDGSESVVPPRQSW